MCTVTYLPTYNGFLLTSNRDEALIRKPAARPLVYHSASGPILFPRDGDAGGTWIATSANYRTVCLLNGAFYPHHHNPPYKKSRGLVVLDFFDSESVKAFVDTCDLNGIEPFTMLLIEEKKLYEFRWDGVQKYFKEIDATQPLIRCSVTLYAPEVIALREKWFSNWLQKHNKYEAKEILKFHLFAGENDAGTNIRMSRSGLVKTVSVTCIERSGNMQKMYYSSLQGNNGFYFSEHGFDSSEPENGFMLTEETAQ
jgi:hypothetical protein